MGKNHLKVSEDIVVELAYILTLEDGEEIDRADTNSPFVYLHGAGNIIPGLEKALDGMVVGETKDVVVPPVDGYGEYKTEEVVEVPRVNLPPTVTLKEGQPLSVTDHHSGQAFRAYIKKVGKENVELDFNHPLAGKKLFFNVEILDLRESSPAERAGGLGQP